MKIFNRLKAIRYVGGRAKTSPSSLRKPLRSQRLRGESSRMFHTLGAVTLVLAACVPSYPISADQERSPALTGNRIQPAQPQASHLAECRCLHLHERPVGASRTEDKPWTDADVISGEELSKLISSSHAVKPVIFQVGIEALYREAHIPDSIFAGPASEPEGLALLRAKTKAIARNKEIVIYCGCCPWQDCPNIKPAFIALQQLGFKKVKLLSIPTDFHQDWVNKGLPTVRS